MTSRFYRKNAAKVRFQGAKGVKSSVFESKRAQKGLKWVHKGLFIPHFCSLFIVKVAPLVKNVPKLSKILSRTPKNTINNDENTP